MRPRGPAPARARESTAPAGPLNEGAPFRLSLAHVRQSDMPRKANQTRVNMRCATVILAVTCIFSAAALPNENMDAYADAALAELNASNPPPPFEFDRVVTSSSSGSGAPGSTSLGRAVERLNHHDALVNNILFNHNYRNCIEAVILPSQAR